MDITLSEALCGFSIPLKHLDDRTIVIKSAPGEIIKPGDFKAVDGEGMPLHQNPFSRGRLFVHFKVAFPSKGELSPDTIIALQALLPPSTRATHAVGDEGVEFVNLSDIDTDSFGKFGSGAGGEAYESDEEGGGRGGGGGGVQCAQQ